MLIICDHIHKIYSFSHFLWGQWHFDCFDWMLRTLLTSAAWQWCPIDRLESLEVSQESWPKNMWEHVRLSKFSSIFFMEIWGLESVETVEKKDTKRTQRTLDIGLCYEAAFPLDTDFCCWIHRQNKRNKRNKKEQTIGRFDKFRFKSSSLSFVHWYNRKSRLLSKIWDLRVPWGAARDGDLETLKMLISEGWDIGTRDHHGSNALLWAAGGFGGAPVRRCLKMQKLRRFLVLIAFCVTCWKLCHWQHFSWLCSSSFCLRTYHERGKMINDVRCTMCTFTTTGKCGKCSSWISALTVHLMDLSCQTRFVGNFALFRWRPCGALSFPSGSQSGPPCASEGVTICDTLLTVLFMFFLCFFFFSMCCIILFGSLVISYF